MDIKDLNKPQLILLAVLLSFITSIATGITTVTLMQQAPASFTTPVNNVIRQTIEKIQQVEGKTVTQTVVVKEEDLVVDAIDKNKSSLFAVSKEEVNLEGIIVEVPVGRGLAVSGDGIIAADAALVPDKQVYFLKNESGKFKADFISRDSAGFSFLKIGEAVNGTDKSAIAVPVFGDLEKMKIGQKIIVVGNGISSFIFEGSKDLKMTVAKSNGGAAVLDLDGNLLGMALSGETASFASIASITEALKLSLNPADPSISAEETMPAAPVLAPETKSSRSSRRGE